MNLLTSTTPAPECGGVYRVTNLLDSRVYIGQSANVRNRLRQHVKASSHSPLSHDIQVYGTENFSWDVLQESESLDERHELEKFWIARTRSTEVGYNKASGGPGPTGFRMPESAKEKLRLAFTGRHDSEDTKERKRVAATGFRHSQTTKDLLSKLRTGVPMPEGVAAKMSKARLGGLNPKARRVRLSIPGANLEFETATELAAALGISRLTIVNWLRSGLPNGILQAVDGKVVRTASKIPNGERDPAALTYVE